MKTLLTTLLLATSTLTFAQVTDSYLSADTRYDNVPAKDFNRQQARIRIGFTIDAKGVVEIVGLAATGPSYNNDWLTVISPSGADQVEIAFRNLYLRKTFGEKKQYSAEFGALTPPSTIGAAGLAPTGWIDGLRLSANTKVGKFKVTAGSLGNFKTPNAFSRQFDANFIELEMEQKYFDEIVSKTAVEIFNGDPYLREGLKYDLKALGDHVIKLFGEALYDFERNAFNYELGAEYDVLKSFVAKLDNRVNLKVYFSNLNSNIPNRGDQVSAFYTYGPRFTTQIGGKIDQKGNANWFARGTWGQTPRYDVGISIKIPSKK